MTTNEYLRMTYENRDWFVRPKVVCADGFTISIQATEWHYCNPRRTYYGDYTEVELGYPSVEDELINDYAEGYDYTDTVYGNVPVEIVDKLLEKHGGIVI